MLTIFDYFGVIAQDHFWYQAQDIAAGRHKSADMQEFNRVVNIGDMSWDEFCHKVANDIGLSVDDVRAGYQKHKVTPHIVELIHDLRSAGHRTALLSNASAEYLVPIMTKLGFGLLFDSVYISSDMGYAKPDKRAFSHVLNMEKLLPHEAIMIDDNAINVDSATSVGMAGIVFNDVLSCRESLKKLLIL